MEMIAKIMIFKCLTVMNTQMQVHEVAVNEFGMAQITYAAGDWSLEADVIEEKINSVMLTHLPTKSFSQTHSISYPFNHLSLRFGQAGQQASVECELK